MNYQKCFENIMRQIFIFILCMLCVLVSACARFDTKSSHVASCIIEDGAFIEKNNVLSNVYENYSFFNDGRIQKVDESDIVTVFEREDARFELYFFGDSLCLNAFWKDCEGQYKLEDLAAFVQCFHKDKTYQQILDFMKKQCENRPNNEYVMQELFGVDNILFKIADIEGNDEYNMGIFLEVIPEFINYDKNDPQEVLHYLSSSKEDVYSKIENMSYSQARELVDYYRNHEMDDIGGIKALCDAAGVNLNYISSGYRQDSTSTQDYSYGTHYCEQCGKTAAHSIRGLNGYDEWYCDEHWQQMQDSLDYMLNN